MDVSRDFLPPGAEKHRSNADSGEDEKGVLCMLSQRSIRRIRERSREHEGFPRKRVNLLRSSDLFNTPITNISGPEDSLSLCEFVRAKGRFANKDHFGIPSFGSESEFDPLPDSFIGDSLHTLLDHSPQHNRKISREFDVPLPKVKRQRRASDRDMEPSKDVYTPTRHDSLENNTISTAATDTDHSDGFDPIDYFSEVDPGEVRARLLALETAMDNSMKTQQQIHNWDRQMGLKRSHSKTMRLSSQSRKKALGILRVRMGHLQV